MTGINQMIREYATLMDIANNRSPKDYGLVNGNGRSRKKKTNMLHVSKKAKRNQKSRSWKS